MSLACRCHVPALGADLKEGWKESGSGGVKSKMKHEINTILFTVDFGQQRLCLFAGFRTAIHRLDSSRPPVHTGKNLATKKRGVA